MKLSVKILSLVLCLSMLTGIYTFSASAAPDTLTGSVKTDSAPITVNGTDTGVTLTQYLLQSGSKYSTAADGLVSVLEFTLSDKLTMAVLNGGEYTWTKDTMGNNAVVYNKTHTDGTVIAAINGDPWIVNHTDYDGDGKAATGASVKHVSVSRGTMIIAGELWASHQIDDENNLAREDNAERGTGASRGPVFGIKADGTAMIGQPSIKVTIQNTTTDVSVSGDGINRLPAPNSVILYNQRCGTESFAFEDAYEIYLECTDSAFHLGKATTGTVVAIFASGDTAERPAITEKTLVISARGSSIRRVTDKFAVGDTISVTPEVYVDAMNNAQKTEWANVTEAMAGFFTLVQNGNPTGQPGNSTHYPTSILGLKRDGTVVMVSTTATVDGTRNACLMKDLPGLCQELGLHTAILMDGGGSTTMVTLEGNSYVRRSSAVDGKNSIRSVIHGMGIVYQGVDLTVTNQETKGTAYLEGLGLVAPEEPDNNGADIKVDPSYAYGYLAQVETINGVEYEDLIGRRDPNYSNLSSEEKPSSIQPAVLDGLELGEDNKIILSGWAQVNGGQGKYYWSLDKLHWYECTDVTLSDAEAAIADRAREEGNMKAPSAAKGRFTDMTVDLSAFDDEVNFTVYFAVSSSGNGEKLCHFLTIENVVRPVEETETETETSAETEVETTEAPAETTAEATKKGCGSVLSVSAVAILCAMAAAVALKKD